LIEGPDLTEKINDKGVVRSSKYYRSFIDDSKHVKMRDWINESYQVGKSKFE